jgi:DNA-binding SARP family transcriptional activator
VAARLYREALAVWRGPALVQFGGSPWAVPGVARLAELQSAAREELVDLELDAGRHAELEQLATAHPLRERLHGRLMLALSAPGGRPTHSPPTSAPGACSTPSSTWPRERCCAAC